MEGKESTRMKVFQLLMESESTLSFGEISRRLRIAKSLAFFHVKKLVEEGVLVERRDSGVIYYDAQPIFTDELEDTLRTLEALSGKVVDASPQKVANCLRVLLFSNAD